MKTLIRYPLTLFVLLLIGYSQLFVPIYRGCTIYSPVKAIKDSERGVAVVLSAPEIEPVFIEEDEEKEDEWPSLKAHSNDFPSFYYSHSPESPFQGINNRSSLFRYFHSTTFFRSPYLVFRVFRL